MFSSLHTTARAVHSFPRDSRKSHFLYENIGERRASRYENSRGSFSLSLEPLFSFFERRFLLELPSGPLSSGMHP